MKKIYLTIHGVGKIEKQIEHGERCVWIGPPLLKDIIKLVNDAVQITVDDGNHSDITHVLPCLLAHQVRAHFFIPCGKLGQKGYLRIKDVKSLYEAGMQIGSHGLAHRDWRKFSREQLRTELCDSKHCLEDIIGQAVTAASCPLGGYNRNVLNALRQAGYETIYTSDRGYVYNDDWIIPRNSIHNFDTAKSVFSLVNGGERFNTKCIHAVKRFLKRWR